MDVRAEVLIHRPVAEVAAYAMDPQNDTGWIGGVRAVTPSQPPPLRPGHRVSRVARFLGRRIEYVLEVRRFEPPHLLSMTSVAGPFPMEVTYEFRDAAGGTQASIVLGGDATGFFRLAAPLLRAASRRSIVRDLRRLKTIMEAAAPPPVSRR